MWILTAFPVIRKPMFNAEFLQWKHCGSFLMKHNSDEQVQLFDTYRHLFIRSHLAFGRHYRRRTPWPHAYSHRNQPQTLSTDSLDEALGRTHFSAGEKNVALSFALSSCFLLARSQALLWAHRCCRPVSSWDRSSNFGAQGLRWRGTTFVFPTEDPFFSRVLAWRVADVVNRTLWIAFKTFCRSPRNSFVPWEASASESCDTQPNCDTLFTPFFQPFVLLFIKFVMRKQTRVSRLTTRSCLKELAFGRMPMFTRSSRAGTLQKISARLSSNGIHGYFCLGCFSSPTHTSTSWQGWLGRCGGSVFWFLRTILGYVAETAT